MALGWISRVAIAADEAGRAVVGRKRLRSVRLSGQAIKRIGGTDYIRVRSPPSVPPKNRLNDTTSAKTETLSGYSVTPPACALVERSEIS